jgi:hypothetical protein
MTALWQFWRLLGGSTSRFDSINLRDLVRWMDWEAVRAGHGYLLWKVSHPSVRDSETEDLAAITMVVGIASYWVIVDFPSDATFLTPEERELVRRRLEADGQHGARAESFRWSEFQASFKDWKTYTGMIMYMGVDGALYAFSLFLPVIIKNMNKEYSATTSQLLTVAPYAFACVVVPRLQSCRLTFPDSICWVSCRQIRTTRNIQHCDVQHWSSRVSDLGCFAKSCCFVFRSVFGCWWNLPLYIKYNYVGEQQL